MIIVVYIGMTLKDAEKIKSLHRSASREASPYLESLKL